MSTHGPGQPDDDQTPGDDPSLLAVVTAQPDDPRATLDQEHGLYGHALRAWREQDHWTDRECELFWFALLAAWPRAKVKRSVRKERAWEARILFDGHGATYEQVAEALCCTPRDAHRLVREGREAATRPGATAVRVPRVIDPEHEARPEPPFAYVLGEPPPPRFSWDHPEPHALTFTDEDGGTSICTPFLASPWEPLSDREAAAFMERAERGTRGA